MASNEFYSIHDIQKQLHCSYCEHRIDIPKILPCGNTICSKCETSFIQSSEKECKSCSQVHAIPTKGFIINKVVAELLKITPAKVYRGEVHKQATDLVSEIGILNKNLEDRKNNVDSIVADYCDVLRTCVDIKTESEINQLNNFRDLLLEKIDKYEKECKDRSIEKLKLEKFIKECNENHAKWAQFLNKENISDKETSVVLEEATKQMNVLNKFRNKFENSIFGSRKLVFYENKKQISPSILGLIIECVSQKQQIQFNYRTEEAQVYYKPSLVKINDTTVCLASSIEYPNDSFTDFRLKLTIITDGAVIKEVEEYMDSDYFNYYSTLILKDCLLVYFFQSSTGQAVFKTYDFDLNLIKSVNQEFFFSELFTDEKLIYGYSLNTSLWLIFDENLNSIESIAIGNGSAYPFIKHKDSQIELKYGHLFSYFNRELRVVDNEKRTLLMNLKLDEKTFPNPTFVRPCSSNLFYVIDSTSKTVQTFDFEFNYFHEFKIDSVAEISSVSLTNDGDIVFYDYKATTAYLF